MGEILQAGTKAPDFNAPVTPDQKPAHQSGWAFPGAVMGMGALLVLANELAE